MAFISSRGKAPAAEEMLLEAWVNPPRREHSSLRGMIPRGTSVAQDAFFAPKTWVSEIDRKGPRLAGVSVPQRINGMTRAQVARQIAESAVAASVAKYSPEEIRDLKRRARDARIQGRRRKLSRRRVDMATPTSEGTALVRAPNLPGHKGSTQYRPF